MSQMPQTIRRKHNVLEDAAELLRLLAAVEHAHLLDDQDALVILLGQVTPTTCNAVAGELELLAGIARTAHAATRSELLHAIEASPPIPPGGSNRGEARPLENLAPVIPLDPHSRRV